ncbi:MAG: type IV pilin protein [Burkholderiaceae bacterium]
MMRTVPSQSGRIVAARGFTLIELMIVLAIVAILAAIAYPSYQEQVRKSRRADAQAVLTEAAQWMERYYTQNNNYDAATAFASSGLTASPRGATGNGVYYQVGFDSGVPLGTNAQAFRLQAVPANAMSADPCGTFKLDNVGRRMLSGNSRSDCWGR